MKRETFDKAMIRAWSIARTREPSKIRADIEREEGKQAAAIRDALSLTIDKTKKLGFKRRAEELAEGVFKNTVATLRKKYDAAVKRIAELDAALKIAESWCV